MIYAGLLLVGVTFGVILGWVWRDDEPPRFRYFDIQQHTLAARELELLKQKALATIKAYQDERDAEFRTLRQRARSRRKRPIR